MLEETPNSDFLMHVIHESNDQPEEKEEESVFPPPPGYYKLFNTPQAMQPPSLAQISKMDYQLIYCEGTVAVPVSLTSISMQLCS
jgi:hypothetical protein